MYINESLARLEALPQTVVAHRRDLGKDETVPRHRHRRAQLVYASSGVMTVTTDGGTFVVPPQRAVWMPGGVTHRIDAPSPVAMRTLYVEPSAVPDFPKAVCVLQVSALLRELILAAIAARPDYPPGGPEDRIMSVILDQIRILPVAPLSLPIPADPRLRQIVETLIADPSDARGLEQWARSAGASARTLARLFSAQTGMSFRAWRQQRRLLRALEMLAAGDRVTAVAIELGYESTSAFSAMFRRCLGTTPTRYFDAAGPVRNPEEAFD